MGGDIRFECHCNNPDIYTNPILEYADPTPMFCIIIKVKFIARSHLS